MKPRHTVKLALGQTQMLERSWCNNDVLCLLWKREQCTINWDLTENLCGRRATCNQLQLSVNTPWRCQRLMSQRWSSSTQRQPWHSWCPNAGSVIMLFLSVYLLCILLYFYRLSRDIFCSKKFLEDNTPTVCSLFASLVTKITRIFWRVLTWSGFYLDCLPPTHQEIVAFFFLFCWQPTNSYIRPNNGSQNLQSTFEMKCERHECFTLSTSKNVRCYPVIKGRASFESFQHLVESVRRWSQGCRWNRDSFASLSLMSLHQ